MIKHFYAKCHSNEDKMKDKESIRGATVLIILVLLCCYGLSNNKIKKFQVYLKVRIKQSAIFGELV